jgi:hypothetical protein
LACETHPQMESRCALSGNREWAQLYHETPHRRINTLYRHASTTPRDTRVFDPVRRRRFTPGLYRDLFVEVVGAVLVWTIRFPNTLFYLSRWRFPGFRPRGALLCRLLQELLPLLQEVAVGRVAPAAADDARTHQQRLHSGEPWQLRAHEVPVAIGEGEPHAHRDRPLCRFLCRLPCAGRRVTRIGHWAIARHALLVSEVRPLSVTDIRRARLGDCLRRGGRRRRGWRRLRHRPERLDDDGLEGEHGGSQRREAGEYAAAHRAAAPAPTQSTARRVVLRSGPGPGSGRHGRAFEIRLGAPPPCQMWRVQERGTLGLVCAVRVLIGAGWGR